MSAPTIVHHTVKHPTDRQIASMKWGIKLVRPDLTTDDHRGGRFRYHLDAWANATGPFHKGEPCPSVPGDGVCVALTLSGAQSGGARLAGSTVLNVGYLSADVLGGDANKVRVKRLYVAADPVDPIEFVKWAAAIGADLRSADLGGANLGGANLGGANLGGADLWGANLWGANLRSADLGGANLGGANLGGADLRGANLGGADLRSADLRGADLRSADLRGADLWGANLRSADLRSADLRGAYADEWTRLPVGWGVANGRVVKS